MNFTIAGDSVYAYSAARTFNPALPTLIFVHGAAQDHSVWALQSRYFAHHGNNVLAVDLPGHGRSGGAALASVESIAAWIVELLERLSETASQHVPGHSSAEHSSAEKALHRCALIGHSMGALAVLEAAARSPGRIGKIALLGPAVPMLVSDTLLAAAEANEHVAYEFITQWSFSPGHLLGGNQQPGVWMSGNTLRLMERSRPGVLYTDLVACQQYARGLDAAARIACPTLLLLGERDLMAPPKNAQALIASLRESRVATLPDCGHSLMTEAPDAVLDALRAFV